MIELDTLCNNCGKTVREHCYVHECHYFFRFCSEYFIRKTDDWPDGSHADDRCSKCGNLIVIHYRFDPFALVAMGTTINPEVEVVYLLPSWIGCQDAPAGPSDSLHA